MCDQNHAVTQTGCVAIPNFNAVDDQTAYVTQCSDVVDRKSHCQEDVKDVRSRNACYPRNVCRHPQFLSRPTTRDILLPRFSVSSAVT